MVANGGVEADPPRFLTQQEHLQLRFAAPAGRRVVVVSRGVAPRHAGVKAEVERLHPALSVVIPVVNEADRIAAGSARISELGVAFHKYAYESIRPEEARRAVSKDERDSVRQKNTSP